MHVPPIHPLSNVNSVTAITTRRITKAMGLFFGGHLSDQGKICMISCPHLSPSPSGVNTFFSWFAPFEMNMKLCSVVIQAGLSRIYALLSVKFSGSKICLWLCFVVWLAYLHLSLPNPLVVQSRCQASTFHRFQLNWCKLSVLFFGGEYLSPKKSETIGQSRIFLNCLSCSTRKS